MHTPKSWNMHFFHWLLVLLTCIWCAAFSLNVSPSYTISLVLQDHHARPFYTVTSIINAQISLVPRLPISFLLALPVIKRRLALNLCIHSLLVVSNRWTGLLDWIAGLDCWTGLLDWIPKKDVRLACKTACVVKTYASQGHTDVAEPRKRGARVTWTRP